MKIIKAKRHEIETIDQLLEHNGYPVAFVQGYHTRIIKNDTHDYEVLAKDKDGRYTVRLYHGDSETSAVWAFIENEER